MMGEVLTCSSLDSKAGKVKTLDHSLPVATTTAFTRHDIGIGFSK